MKKAVKLFLVLCWCIFCIIGIITNAHKYNFVSWLIVISVSLFPILILAFTRREKDNKPVAEQIEAADIITEEKEDIYIETGNTIYRVDGKPISDEEVPYLVQIGMEKALRRINETKNK